MTVTVYSKKNCVACNQTYKAFDRKGVNYNVIDITADEEAYAKVKSLGYMQAPVVIVSKEDGFEDHWSGFRLDKISETV